MIEGKTYIGIDPGSSSGCIAFISYIGKALLTHTIEFDKYTTKEWFYELMEWCRNHDCIAVLEKVHGMPGMNVSAVSAFMKNVGHIEMALILTFCGD